MSKHHNRLKWSGLHYGPIWQMKTGTTRQLLVKVSHVKLQKSVQQYRCLHEATNRRTEGQIWSSTKLRMDLQYKTLTESIETFSSREMEQQKLILFIKSSRTVSSVSCLKIIHASGAISASIIKVSCEFFLPIRKSITFTEEMCWTWITSV